MVTPNRDEAALLWGKPITNVRSLTQAAKVLARDLAGPHVLAKGGHLRTGQAIDVLAYPDGRTQEFAVPRIPNVDPHGTGCTYSAAIATGLAQGLTVSEAVLFGKGFITRALRYRFESRGYQLLNHLPVRW